MSIKSNFPTIRPSLNLDFANSKTLDPRVEFNRASAATYFDANGVLQTAAAGVPRFDHAPMTGESKGLLIEEQRTNLLTYSEQFDNAAWTKLRATVTANVATAPDGTLTADKLVEDTTANNARYIHSLATAPSGAVSFSVFIKAAGRTRVRLSAYEASVPSNPVSAYFDLATQTVTTTSGLNTAASIIGVGDGWYRCTCSGTSAGTAATWTISSLDASGSQTYTGDGYSGIYIWGAQLEVGAFPTSYIPTTTAQVTRSAESASMTGTNFSSWFRADEGSFVVAYSRNSDKAAGNQIPAIASDGTGSNIIAITGAQNGTADRVLIIANNVGQMNAGFVSYTANQLLIRSIGYKVYDVVTAVNGGTLTADTSALIPTVNQLSIGYAPYFTSSRLNGHIRRLAYYPKRLPDAQLQALTA